MGGETELDRALRMHSEAVREERTQLANDELRAQGKPLRHCGVEAKRNDLGDWECTRCGDVFA